MGKEKTKLAQDYEQKFSSPEKYVCVDCVEDSFLKGIIAKNLAKKECDYCGKGSEENIAASVEAIMEPIASAFFHLFGYDYPDECDLAELLTTADALRKIPLKCHEALFKDVASAFWWDRWVDDPGSFHDPGNSMRYSWEKFVQGVKHRVRFFFSSVESKYKFSFEKSPVKLFEEIGQIVSAEKLIKPLKAGTDLFRVRHWPIDKDWYLADIEKNLGAPPNSKAQSGRMNPAGISYLYLARERETAIAEVLSKPPCQAAVGCFKVRRDLRILDLIALPGMPSIFDNERYHERELIAFLNDFIREISKPVQKDGTEHLDYVPSQVVCEYFAKIFKSEDGKPIDSLEYPSSIRQEGRNIVLFPPPKKGNCFSDLVTLSRAEEIEFQTWSELCKAIQHKSGDL
ncbi:MAG: RES domain-containing protein [Proteobacteria bacterium]|nr:RES domain-containing protein [Pseudomonadota bacterium]MBU4294545.1 RES domain-containing protein [Pseudomonadota bacterium]MCG2747081.1 RES domain-containing protein [Desulfobulbaceae bacterium]